MRADVMRRWMNQRGYHRIANVAGESRADVYIYDAIAWWGVDVSTFVPAIAALDVERITVHVNSPGGDVFDAVALYNALREHPAEVEVRVEGLAASAASYIAMAGDRIVMARHATMMIHDPWAVAIGDADEMRRQAAILDGVGENIASIYAERAGGSVREWRERMLAETWYSDREAVTARLADEVAGDSDAVENLFDLSVYRNPPDALQRPAASRTERHPKPLPSMRAVEDALRDVGLSQAARKRLLAALDPDDLHEALRRDVDDLDVLVAGLVSLKADASARALLGALS